MLAVVWLVLMFVFGMDDLVEAQQTTRAMLPDWFHIRRQVLRRMRRHNRRRSSRDCAISVTWRAKISLIERRYAEGRLDRMAPFVQEFVEQKVDVIIGVNNVVIRAAKEATKTIPIVMISSVDPVAAGYVESFARPGGNITGLAWLSRDISAKRVELLEGDLAENRESAFFGMRMVQDRQLLSRSTQRQRKL